MDKELEYMLLEDLIIRNSHLLINERIENIKTFDKNKGIVFKVENQLPIVYNLNKDEVNDYGQESFQNDKRRIRIMAGLT